MAYEPKAVADCSKTPGEQVTFIELTAEEITRRDAKRAEAEAREQTRKDTEAAETVQLEDDLAKLDDATDEELREILKRELQGRLAQRASRQTAER